MKIRVLKLGTVCHDTATELDGTLTHWTIGMEGYIRYYFQPKGLNNEGMPVKKMVVGEKRLEVTDENFEMVDVPFDILGTQVTDNASGFTGMAIGFIRHINGCFHVFIQPKGRLTKTNNAFEDTDFDLRGCVGEKIPVLSPEECRQSEEEAPSPTSGVLPREVPRV